MTKYVMLPPINDTMRAWAQQLQQALPQLEVVLAEDEAAAARHLPHADGAYGWVAPSQLPTAARLRLLQNPLAGPPVGWYYPALAAHPVTVSNPRGIYSDHIAQHILMYLLALARGLPDYLAAQRARRWDKGARRRGYVDLAQATVLINGVGGIGAETARLCQAFGSRVIGVDPRLEEDFAGELIEPSELDDHLGEADFVVTTVPHTPETEFMWDRERFQQMKRSAYFVNIGRGMTTRLADLVQALEAEEIAGAALDVYEVEPLPAEHPLWGMENVILTPHIAVAEAENLDERRYELILANARQLLEGGEFRNVVDKGKWY